MAGPGERVNGVHRSNRYRGRRRTLPACVRVEGGHCTAARRLRCAREFIIARHPRYTHTHTRAHTTDTRRRHYARPRHSSPRHMRARLCILRRRCLGKGNRRRRRLRVIVFFTRSRRV